MSDPPGPVPGADPPAASPAGEWLPRLAVLRPVTITMVLLALCVTGALAFLRIPVQLMPSGYEFPYIWVWAPVKEAPPRELEEQVIKPIEAELSSLPDLRSFSSRIRPGNVSFELEFQQRTQMSEAWNQVSDRLERARVSLPDDVERFGVYKYDPADEPVVWGGIAVPASAEDPGATVRDVIRRKLERVPGVARVETSGADAAQVHVDFDADAVDRHQVELARVVAGLGTSDFVLPGGRLVEGGRTVYVRSVGRLGDTDAIRALPIREGLRLGDIAHVAEAPPESSTINRIDGRPAVLLEVFKESDANTVEVGDAVRHMLTEELPALPELKGWDFVLFFDQAKMIRESLDNLLRSGLEGGLLAALVLWAFLRRVRMTLLIALSIPVSTLMAVIVLYAQGDSLNLLSLMGLMLSVGMSVDTSVVVVENIFRWRRELRVSHPDEPPARRVRTAAVRGTGEVALAMVASTLSSIVVFLPLILMGNDAQFAFLMGSVGLPVCYSLLASLVVSLVFIPLATTWFRSDGGEEPSMSQWFSGMYHRALAACIRRRADTLLAAALLFFSTFWAMSHTAKTDETQSNLGDFVVSVEVPPDFSRRERLELLKTLEDRYLAHREEWGIKAVRTRMHEGSQKGYINVFLEPRGSGDLDREEIVALVEKDLPEVPGCEIWVGWDQGDSGGKRATVTLYGEDSDRLSGLVQEVRHRLLTIPTVQTAEVDAAGDSRDEIRVRVDHGEAARHGLTAEGVARAVSFALRGVTLPPMWQDDRPEDVIARYRAADRQDLGTLLRLRLPGTGAGTPTLGELAEVTRARGFSEIRREDGRTALPVTLQLKGDDPRKAFEPVAAAMAGIELPRGYSWSKGDRWEEMEEEDAAQRFALLMSIVLVFVLMAMLFESVTLPFSILTSIPFALFGVYWMLWATRTPFDLMAGIGLIILIGIVVNNAIVLVDRVGQLRRAGVGREQALVEAGRQRLRPILMTAGTTLMGLVPLAVGQANLAGIPYYPLGRAVIGGLVASTLLTLLVVPLAYTVFDDLRSTLIRLRALVAARLA